MKLIKRKLADKIKELSRYYPVLVITGPRQSGKTTLAKNLFPEYYYVNLERPETLSSAMNDPKEFLKLGSGKKMIIDEAQRFPDLFSYIQAEVDEKKIPGQFVLTGSQNLNLSAKVSQSLAGRSGNFVLTPLTIRELNRIVEQTSDPLNLILRGFYPRLFNVNISTGDFYQDYVSTYVERDLRQLKNIGNLTDFQRFMRLLAGRAGQLVNSSSLASDVGADHKTINSWLTILEASYLVFRLAPYFVNFGKRIVKSPKIYFYDTGLLCFLLGIGSAAELRNHYAVGSIFENFVIADFWKNCLNARSTERIYFWRNNKGNEVDLLIDHAGKQVPVEIKAGKTFNSEMLKGIEYFNALRKVKGGGILVYGGDLETKINGNKIENWQSFCLRKASSTLKV